MADRLVAATIKINRANVRVSAPLVLEHLFGRDFAQRVHLALISVDGNGDLVLQISGDVALVPEGEATGQFRKVQTLGGEATVFEGLKEIS